MKERLTEDVIAMRAAMELKDGDYCNLGLGIPQLCAIYVPDTVKVQTENGAIAYGSLLELPDPEEMSEAELEAVVEELHAQRDANFQDAGARSFIAAPGMSFCDLLTSFAMIRSGRLSTVLGGLQVAENGDLAIHSVGSDEQYPQIGGSMDLAWGAKRVIVTMTHTTRNDEPKIVKQLTLPMSTQQCVDMIITDLAVIKVTPDGLLLKEIAPGWSVEEVQALTEPKLKIADDLKEYEL